MVTGWAARRRYQALVTVAVGLGWLPVLSVGFMAPADAEPLSLTGGYMVLTPMLLHGVHLGIGFALRAPYPNSAAGVMLLSPIGIAATVASEVSMWPPALAGLRWVVAPLLVGVLAWASGRWASELVLTEAMDTPLV